MEQFVYVDVDLAVILRSPVPLKIQRLLIAIPAIMTQLSKYYSGNRNFFPQICKLLWTFVLALLFVFVS